MNSVQQLIQRLQWLQAFTTSDNKKRDISTDATLFESTESIISYDMKKQVRYVISQTDMYRIPPSDLFFLLRLINEYAWSDDALKHLYAHLCKLNQTLALIECIAIKTYVSSDNVHQPYYTQLKKRMLDDGHRIGDYGMNRVYLLYMIGEMVGAFVVSDKVEWSYFETKEIQAFVAKRYPSLTF